MSEKVVSGVKIVRYTGNDKLEVLPEAQEHFDRCKYIGQNPIWLCKQWVGATEFAAVFSVKVK